MFSSLKYLIIAIFGAIGFLFVLWFGILVLHYPDDWQNYTLDLQGTLTEFKDNFSNVSFSGLGGYTFGDGESILSNATSWLSGIVDKGFDFLNTSTEKMNDVFAKNSWLSFTLMLTGITQLFYAVMLIAKTILILVYVVVFFFNVIDLLISFMVAFLNVISHPHFQRIDKIQPRDFSDLFNSFLTLC